MMEIFASLPISKSYKVIEYAYADSAIYTPAAYSRYACIPLICI